MRLKEALTEEPLDDPLWTFWVLSRLREVESGTSKVQRRPQSFYMTTKSELSPESLVEMNKLSPLTPTPSNSFNEFKCVFPSLPQS